MREHARVTLVARAEPRELEAHLIAKLDLPLNLEGNGRHPFSKKLSALRTAARREALDAAGLVLPRP